MANNYAVIGMGFIFPRHRQAIEATGGQILLTCDTDPSKEIKGLPFYTDYHFLEADPRWREVDTVVICTPNDTHIEIARWALKRGKKVLCEKPMALSATELGPFIREPRLYGVLQLRYHPILREVAALRPKGEIILAVRVHRSEDYFRGWKGDEKRSGGVLSAIGVHYLDLCMEIWGRHYTILDSHTVSHTATGLIDFGGQRVRYHIEVTGDPSQCGRFFLIDGKQYPISFAENLAAEGLHTKVYEYLVQDEGVRAEGALPVLRLIDELKAYGLCSV